MAMKMRWCGSIWGYFGGRIDSLHLDFMELLYEKGGVKFKSVVFAFLSFKKRCYGGHWLYK